MYRALQPSPRFSFDLWRNQIPWRAELTIKHGKLRCHPVVVQSPLEIAFFPSPPLPSSCTRDESARVVQRQRLLIAAKHYSKADNVGRPTVTRRISVGWIVGFLPRDIKSVANQVFQRAESCEQFLWKFLYIKNSLWNWNNKKFFPNFFQTLAIFPKRRNDIWNTEKLCHSQYISNSNSWARCASSFNIRFTRTSPHTVHVSQ